MIANDVGKWTKALGLVTILFKSYFLDAQKLLTVPGRMSSNGGYRILGTREAPLVTGSLK